LEFSFSGDQDLQELLTIFAHPKTAAYLARVVDQFSQSNSHAQSLISFSNLVSAQQLLLPKGMILHLMRKYEK
jgi:hypothetical protein